VEETTVVETDEQARAKWWSKKLKEKLRYLQQKLEHIAYGLKDFRLTGRLGVIFNLLAPTILTGTLGPRARRARVCCAWLTTSGRRLQRA
jgi:hypothetical protein